MTFLVIELFIRTPDIQSQSAFTLFKKVSFPNRMKLMRFSSFSCRFSRLLPRLSELTPAYSHSCWYTNVHGRMTKAVDAYYMG